MEWTASNLNGASGGMIIPWKKGTLDLNYNFIGPDFVGVNIKLVERSFNMGKIFGAWVGTLMKLVEVEKCWGKEDLITREG